MEKRLRTLFNYQRFEGNERLEKLISETEERSAQDLSDDDLAFVSAAGEAETVGESGGEWAGFKVPERTPFRPDSRYWEKRSEDGAQNRD